MKNSRVPESPSEPNVRLSAASGPEQVSIGLVAGLDYGNANLDVHVLLQRMKLHPLFREILAGGELVEWGAKTIPEGGFYSLPERLFGDGVVIRPSLADRGRNRTNRPAYSSR